MTPNANWPRWIRASINHYFGSLATTRSLPILVEGIDEASAETIQAGDHAELRIGGPSLTPRPGDFHLRVGINLLFTSFVGGEGKNPYDIIQHIAAFQAAMYEPIPIYKYGLGADDDDSHIGCLALVSGRNEAVEFFDFGQVGKEERVRQLMLDARYYIDLVP